jgi:CheY-like chemotaxis protein
MRNTHVLVSEDVPEDIFIYQQAFKRLGISSYRFVTTGQEVIDYLQGKGRFENRTEFPFPDWLLIEMRMPQLDGYGVLDWLYHHQHCRVIPTVGFSASDRDEDVKRAYELGVNAYFVKPSGFQRMIDVLSLIDHFWKIALSPKVTPDLKCG